MSASFQIQSFINALFYQHFIDKLLFCKKSKPTPNPLFILEKNIYVIYVIYVICYILLYMWESIQEWTSKTCGRQSSCLSRPYPSKSFKGCLPQILLGPFLNTLSHIWKQFLIEKKVIKKSITICRGIFWYVSITCFAAIIWNI